MSAGDESPGGVRGWRTGGVCGRSPVPSLPLHHTADEIPRNPSTEGDTKVKGSYHGVKGALK